MIVPPTANELLADAALVGGMRQAFVESNVGEANAIEQGGFIVSDPLDGTLVVIRLPAAACDSLSYPICADGTYEGREIVGSFHTHPNTGPEWQQDPSPQDIRLSQDYPETMGPHQFVIARDVIYHIDNNGVVTGMGGTPQLLGIDGDDST